MTQPTMAEVWEQLNGEEIVQLNTAVRASIGRPVSAVELALMPIDKVLAAFLNSTLKLPSADRTRFVPADVNGAEIAYIPQTFFQLYMKLYLTLKNN